MRTVEVLFVIIIILGAFIIATQFATLPSPREAFGTNLRELSQSTMETLDSEGVLTETIFKGSSDPAWGDLKRALSASLPPNVVYNLTVYDISSQGGAITYQLANSISDASFGAGSDAASVMLVSPNVTFTQDPQKVGQSSGQNITLYILNCNDANGWWITGYTGQSLASDLNKLLSKYFTTTVLVNSTDELGSLLDGNLLTAEPGESVEDAVVLNTFGESVPIPTDYCDGGSKESQGFDPYHDGGTYARYFHTLGSLTRQYNWTWVSIVGYPFYYVTNTGYFDDNQNNFGIYGMEDVRPAGANAFLQGLTNRAYNYDTEDIKGQIPGVVSLTSEVLDLCNYYGIYPSPYHSAARALDENNLVNYYGLDTTGNELFNRPSSPNDNYIPAATYVNSGGGALTSIGLTRISDARVAVLALLLYYHPTVYRSEFGASGTTRLVTLQLGQQGGA